IVPHDNARSRPCFQLSSASAVVPDDPQTITQAVGNGSLVENMRNYFIGTTGRYYFPGPLHGGASHGAGHRRHLCCDPRNPAPDRKRSGDRRRRGLEPRISMEASLTVPAPDRDGTVEDVRFETKDGRTLTGRLHRQGPAPQLAVVLHGGAGFPARF